MEPRTYAPTLLTGTRIVLWAALLTLTALGQAAAQQRVPDAASPGGVQPQAPDKWDFPERADQQVFPIPPVIERPLGLEEGPRLVVQQFQLEGAVDRPESGISVANIQALLDNSRAAQPPEGYTINQLQEVANEVARYYRNNGFVLAQAFVPEQTVRDGIVTVRVLEGRLGRIEVEDNQRYSGAQLTKPFNALLGGPVEQESIESALLLLTDYPGLTVFGVFSAGDEVGTTNLVLKVQEEKKVDWSLSADNYGTDLSGEYRGTLNLAFNNLTGAGDVLSGYLLQTVDPTNGTYGAINYNRPLGRGVWEIGAGYTQNAYELGEELSGLDIDGDTYIGGVYGRRTFRRSRTLNWYGMGDLTLKTADVERQGTRVAKDDLTVVSAEIGFDHIDTKRSGIDAGALTISVGIDDFLGSNVKNDPGSSRRGGSGEFAGGDFSKYVLRYQRLQRIVQNHALLFRVEGQYSDDLLTSLEQYSLGGPNSVRAYAVAERLVDKGGFGSLEWIINAPGFASRPAFDNRTWGEIFQLSLFYDYAGGTNTDPLPNEERTVDLKGYGLGLQFLVPSKWIARLDVATQDGDPDPVNGRDPQIFFRFNYEF